MSRPSTMRALVHSSAPGPDGLRVEQVARPEPGDDEVLIRVVAAGLNRHELFAIAGHTGDDLKIVGADAVGTVVSTGYDAGQELGGCRAMVNPCLGWTDIENVPEVPTILGGPVQGTFAEFVRIPASNVHQVPPHLSDAEAAALPLAYHCLPGSGHQGERSDAVTTSSSPGPLAVPERWRWPWLWHWALK